jgi:hypothetical protein
LDIQCRTEGTSGGNFDGIRPSHVGSLLVTSVGRANV